MFNKKLKRKVDLLRIKVERLEKANRQLTCSHRFVYDTKISPHGAYGVCYGEHCKRCGKTNYITKEQYLTGLKETIAKIQKEEKA
jgi:hypothetical protein